MSKLNLVSSLLFFNISCILYIKINPFVNYMWGLKMSYNWQIQIFYSFLILISLRQINRRREVISIFQQILLFGIIMPIFTISVNTSDYLGESILIWLGFLSTLWWTSLILRISNPLNVQISTNQFRTLSYTVLISLLGITLISNGFNFSLDIANTFSNIYLIREKNIVSGLVSYSTGWIAFMFITLLISDFFEKRKMKFLLIGIITALILFQTFAIKNHLFSVLLLLFFGFAKSKNSFIKFNPVLFFYCIVFLVSFIGLDLFAPFLDRFYYLPGMLNVHYVEYFLDHPNNFFNLSRLGFLFGIENYTKPLGFVIDSYYYGGGMNANTGVYASIYAEIGAIGLLILLPMLIGTTLSLISRFESKFFYFSFLLSVNLGFLMINSPFNDLFLTQGLILPLIMTPFLKTR